VKKNLFQNTIPLYQVFFTRKGTPDDFEAIKIVNDLVFNQKQEGELFKNCRKRPEFIPEL
jgi:hypothetical protein